MKSVIKSIVAAITLSAAGLSASVLPRVGTGTVPNEWTRNMSGVLQAAKETNLPILLAMINDSSSGQGCQHCMDFLRLTINTENFANIVKNYQFYMVLLNYWSSPSEPAYGGVSADVFDMYYYKYQYGDFTYPQVVVIRPDGTRYTAWGYNSRPVSSCAVALYQHIETAIAALSPNKTIFSLSAQSENTVTVQAPTAGVWTGVVTRSGKSGKTGSVAISLEGANKALYKLSASSLEWDSSDGTKTFTVTGPNTFSGGIISDDLTVTIAASGFSGTEVSYETSSQAVTFKDSRVKQSLSDFAAAHAGLDKLSASGGAWYVPSQNNGNVLETMTASDSTLTFTASAGGILKATLGTTRGSVACTSSKGDKVELYADQSVQFGVAAGDKVTFKASAPAGSSDAVVVGFKEFSFTPLTVTLSKPTANERIPYAEMMADKSRADLAWRASQNGCTFSLTCGGVTKDMGTETSGNALDLGFVSNAPETKEYSWSVRASYSASGLLGTAVGTASSKFTVASLPVYDNTASTVVVYKSLGSSIDMSVSSSGTDDVTYSAKGLPNGMKINAQTGVITGSPKQLKNSTVTVTAENAYGSTTKTITLQVVKFPKAYTAPKYVLNYFNDKDEIVGYGLLRITARGKWSASVMQGGRTTKLKGDAISLDDGSVATGSSDLNLVYDTNLKTWSGTASGYRVYGRAAQKAGGEWKGPWNLGLASSSNAKLGGWVTAKVSNTGKVSFTGRISNTVKVSGGCYSTVFPENFVKANLPRWAGHGDVRFGHASTSAGVNVGCAFFANGSVGGHASSGSQVFDSAIGSRWNKSLFTGLNGKELTSFGGGDVKIPVVVDGKKPTFGSNKYNASISCSLTTGQVKMSYKVDGKMLKASGVIYGTGGQSKLLGGGTQGGAPFAVAIE